MLVESIPKEPLNFQILPFDNPRGAHIIHVSRRYQYIILHLFALKTFKHNDKQRITD